MNEDYVPANWGITNQLHKKCDKLQVKNINGTNQSKIQAYPSSTTDIIYDILVLNLNKQNTYCA